MNRTATFCLLTLMSCLVGMAQTVLPATPITPGIDRYSTIPTPPPPPPVVQRYLLAFVLDGDTVRTDSLLCGDPIPNWQPDLPRHFQFSGWSELPDVMPSHNVTAIGTTNVRPPETYQDDSAPVDIFTLDGNCLYHNVRFKDVWDKLPSGIYYLGNRFVYKP